VLIAIAFYILAFTAIAASFMVVASRNPVHSVMFLILTFFAAAGLFILMGAEFLALLLVMVYVGAVATKTVVEPSSDRSNLEQFGDVLYTEYAGAFEAAGLVLLVAMIGAIVLTLRTRKGVKTQNAMDQMARTREDGVELVDIEPGQGLG